MIPNLRSAARPAGVGRQDRHRVLFVTCAVHALHDGFTDTLYLLLPLWQAEFGLGYAAVGALRSLYTSAMAGLQVPAAAIAQRIGGPFMLAAGTLLAAAGYMLAGSSCGFVMLAGALILGGVGSSTQHPIASSLVAEAYDACGSRRALATYNFAGDLGKMALPAATAALLLAMPWRSAALALGVVGAACALAMPVLLTGAGGGAPKMTPPPAPDRSPHAGRAIAHGVTASSPSPLVALAEEGKERATGGQAERPRGGFALLLAIGIIDNATRVGFLIFLPFLLKAKGASIPTVGLALTLVSAGGAAGKLVCGLLGARIGVFPTVMMTEGLTALGIASLLPLPLEPAFALLPVVGIALNGTSSVLYGTVPEIAPAERRQRAFGLFYTGTIGTGALSPAIYGLLGDALGIWAAMFMISAMVLITLPLAWRLRGVLDAKD